jgi:hypothetical protein
MQARDGYFAPPVIGPGLLIISASSAVLLVGPIPRSQSGISHLPPTATGSHHQGSPLRQEVMSQSAPRDEEKAVQEGRGEHRALRITSRPRRSASPSTSTETLPLRRRSPPPRHLPSFPTCRVCGWMLISCFLSRPFARKSSLNWSPNLPPLQLAYPPVRNVPPNTLLRKEPSPHSVPPLPSLFRRTSPSPKQASSVSPNERIASWSPMTRGA